MIIVEGPDNAGKTTLIKQLLELDPTLRILHRERFKPGQATIGQSYLRALIPDDGDRLVHSNSLADRLMASECIYGELFRGGCRMSHAEHEAVRLMLLSYRATVIHCDVADATLQATWAKREQLYDNPLEIAHAYRARMKLIFPSVNVVPYNWESPTAADDRMRLVQQHTKQQYDHRRHLAWWSTMPYGMGELQRPRLILIGDYNRGEGLSLPFMDDDGGNLLARALNQVRQDLAPRLTDSIYATHAMKDSSRDAVLLRSELSYLIDPAHTIVITFGREAHQMYMGIAKGLRFQPTHYATLNHPADWASWKKPIPEFTDRLRAAVTRTSPGVTE